MWVLISRRVSLIAPLLFLPCAAGPAQPNPGPPATLSDDFAGWIYFDQGGDLPVRATLNAADVLLDLPHLERFGLSATRKERDNGGFVLEASLDGTSLRFEASGPPGNTVRGRVRVGTSRTGDFWLHRSARPLDREDPALRVECAGSYRFPSGRVVVVTKIGWNELRYLDFATGLEGTLFATSDSTYFAGSAVYVPTEVTAEAVCRQSSPDAPPELEWTASDGTPERALASRTTARDLVFLNGDVRLAGTVLLPESGTPVPGVVLLGGSNWTGRASIRREADLIAASGVAVLIYDQRGFGDSDGDAVVAFEVSASDARAGAAALRDLPEVMAHAVGVAGRSRGGWFAPLVAAEPGTVDFLLVLVPSGTSPAAQETYRRLGVLEDRGASPAELREARTYLELMYAWIATGSGWDAYRAALDRLSDDWFQVLGGADAPDPEIWAWDRLNAHFDPFPFWERVTVPVLAVLGEEDRVVDTNRGAGRIRAALSRAGNTHADVVVVPGVDHSLRRDPGLPLHMRAGYGPDVWPTIHGWLGGFR